GTGGRQAVLRGAPVVGAVAAGGREVHGVTHVRVLRRGRAGRGVIIEVVLDVDRAGRGLAVGVQGHVVLARSAEARSEERAVAVDRLTVRRGPREVAGAAVAVEGHLLVHVRVLEGRAAARVLRVEVLLHVDVAGRAAAGSVGDGHAEVALVPELR